MTKEEAKRIATGLRTDFKCESDTMVDFCNTVIKALEQEPCEDAISRQAVLEIFGYVMEYWEEHAIDVEPHEIKDALIEQYEFTAKQLSDLPPVTPLTKIDKIRAEIEHHRRKTKDIDPYDLVGDCLDIIDKYKAESEE